VEAVAVKQVPADTLPAAELLVPVGGWDQRQHRVVVGGAKDVDDTGVLEVPEQRAAVHDAVGAPLELRVGERGEQGARQRQVHPGGVLVAPQRPRNAVDRPQDLLGRPVVVGEQVLEVAGRLVEVQDQGEGDVVGHGVLPGLWCHRSWVTISAVRRDSSVP
jgi:hypothetical protein